MRMKFRLEYDDRLILCFLAGMMTGTIAVNLMGNAVQEEAGYVGKLFAAAAGMESGRGLLMTVLRQRLVEYGILWFIAITVFSRRGFYLAALYGGFTSSAVLSVMVCQKGVFGPFYYLAAIMPHYLCYIPSWVLAAASGEREDRRLPLRAAAVSLLFTLAGIAAEALINPVFLCQAAKMG